MTSPELDQALTKYQLLIDQVNLAFQDLRLQYPDDFHCRAGCHQCCLPNLSVAAGGKSHSALSERKP